MKPGPHNIIIEQHNADNDTVKSTNFLTYELCEKIALWNSKMTWQAVYSALQAGDRIYTNLSYWERVK